MDQLPVGAPGDGTTAITQRRLTLAGEERHQRDGDRSDVAMVAESVSRAIIFRLWLNG
jgi:hypothetical protein